MFTKWKKTLYLVEIPRIMQLFIKNEQNFYFSVSRLRTLFIFSCNFNIIIRKVEQDMNWLKEDSSRNNAG